MKKVIAVFFAFVLCSLQSYPTSVFAIIVDANKVILSVDNIMGNTDWTTIDLSAYHPIARNVKSLYIEMHITLRSVCPDDTVRFSVRPYGDVYNERVQLANSSEAGAAGREYIQYVWLPLKGDSRIEYNLSGISCLGAEADVALFIVGYDKTDNRRWQQIY